MPDPYFSEIKYLGGPALDFIEIAVDAGTDVSNFAVTIYRSDGTIRSTNPLAGLTSTNTIHGQDVYIIDTTTAGTFDGLGKTNGLALSDGATVYDFFSFDDLATPITATEGSATGLTSTQIGMAGSGDSLETDDDGASYSVQTTPNSGTIPCLTGGTVIATKAGQCDVEHLVPGDLITTWNGGCRALVKLFSRKLNTTDLSKNPKLYPVRICAGALGHGLPQSDLLVSRQHRMLVSSPIAARMFGTPRVLVAAIKLTDLPGIYVDTSIEEVTYFHLLFDAHEVIIAEGAPTESLFLGAEALNALPDETVKEIAAIFPDFQTRHVVDENGPTIAQGPKLKKLVARHVAHQKPLLDHI